MTQKYVRVFIMKVINRNCSQYWIW